MVGYNRRLDKQWNIARTIMSDIRNTAFGAKTPVKPKQVMQIHSIDRETGVSVKRHVKTKQEAEKLLDTF